MTANYDLFITRNRTKNLTYIHPNKNFTGVYVEMEGNITQGADSGAKAFLWTTSGGQLVATNQSGLVLKAMPTTGSPTGTSGLGTWVGNYEMWSYANAGSDVDSLMRGQFRIEAAWGEK